MKKCKHDWGKYEDEVSKNNGKTWRKYEVGVICKKCLKIESLNIFKQQIQIKNC